MWLCLKPLNIGVPPVCRGGQAGPASTAIHGASNKCARDAAECTAAMLFYWRLRNPESRLLTVHTLKLKLLDLEYAGGVERPSTTSCEELFQHARARQNVNAQHGL